MTLRLARAAQLRREALKITRTPTRCAIAGWVACPTCTSVIWPVTPRKCNAIFEFLTVTQDQTTCVGKSSSFSTNSFRLVSLVSGNFLLFRSVVWVYYNFKKNAIDSMQANTCGQETWTWFPRAWTTCQLRKVFQLEHGLTSTWKWLIKVQDFPTC